MRALVNFDQAASNRMIVAKRNVFLPLLYIYQYNLHQAVLELLPHWLR